MKNAIDQFFSNESIILEGFLVKDDKKLKGDIVSLQLFPGVLVDIKKADVKEMEEATDPVTGRTFVKLSVSEAAEINSLFQLKLARLALSRDSQDIPYSFREDLDMGSEGSPVYVNPPTVMARENSGGGPIIIGGETYPTDSIGEFGTRSNKHFYGYVNDDKKYTDRVQDRRGGTIIP